MGNWDWLDYVPGASNVKGAVQGNWGQAAGGAGYKILAGDVGSGYNTASEGARDVSDQARQFADQQWGRQMEGLQGALGSYQPSQDAWYRMYGAQGPGAAENYWAQNASQFNQPSAQSGAYAGYQSWMNDPWNNATRQGANQASAYLAGPTASGQAYNTMGQGLQNYAGPQNTAAAYGAGAQGFRQPGAAENYYSQNQQRYNTGGNAQNVYDLYSGQLAGPSRSESFNENASYELDASAGDAKRQHMAYQNWANDRTAGQKNEAENKGYVRDAGDVSNYFQSQLGALSGPGQFEQFMSADINGTNPAYERQKAQGIAQINQEMARRGGFQAPAAIDRIGNYTAGLDAEDYQRRRDSAAQAQQMQLARIGQGTSSAQASSGNKLAQGQALQGMDVANEAGELARKGFGRQVTQDMFGNDLAAKQFGLQAAGQSDRSAIDRLQALQGMATAGDQGNLSFLNAGQNAASDAQSQMLARLMGNMSASNMVDQNKLASDQQGLARMLASFNMAQGSDTSNLARANQIFNQGQGVDQSMMARYGMQQDMAQGVDQQKLANLLGGGQLANNAQSAEQQRMAQMFASLFGLNNAQAGQYGQFYGAGGQLSGQSQTDAINALMAAYGYKAQGQEAQAAMPMQIANLAFKYGGAG